MRCILVAATLSTPSDYAARECVMAERGEVQAKFANRRRRQRLASWALGVAAVLAIEGIRGPDGILGHMLELNVSVLTIPSLGLFLAAIVFTYFNWRCPACGLFLGRNGSPQFCPGCGQQLR